MKALCAAPCYTVFMPENYQIGSGLSDQELKIASFWVRNKPLFKRIGYGALIGISSALWLFVAWSLLDAYAISYPREARIPRIITSNQVTIESLRTFEPDPIQTSDTNVFDTTDGRKDLLVEITNPNEKWAATFTYRFNIGGALTPERKGFILPMSQSYITELGYTPETNARTAELAVENIEWMRVTPDDVGASYVEFSERRLDFSFDEITYENDLDFNGQKIGQTSFILNNHSPYGYWNTDLTVILYRADRPVGVTTITERELRPGENRPIKINWFDNISGVSKTEIRANVNILDDDNYLSSSRF